jgi:short-subunit dehydrogenase
MIHYQDRWAVVTGASSGLGCGLAARLADRGMSLVLTGRNEARLNEAAQQIRFAAPSVKVETVAADLSTRSGVSVLLDHVGGRPVEVLVNNAGFGTYGPFAEADADREDEEVAVDISAVICQSDDVRRPGSSRRKQRDDQSGSRSGVRSLPFRDASFDVIVLRALRSGSQRVNRFLES